MREKLLSLMKSEGLTSSRLAEILEIQPSGVSHILSGRNKPGFDLLQKILRRFPRINPDWLLLDSEQMYRHDSPAMSAIGNLPPSLDSDLFAVPTQQPISPAIPDTITVNATSATTTENSGNAATVERVVVFYSDHTFDSFIPKIK